MMRFSPMNSFAAVNSRSMPKHRPVAALPPRFGAEPLGNGSPDGSPGERKSSRAMSYIFGGVMAVVLIANGRGLIRSYQEQNRIEAHIAQCESAPPEVEADCVREGLKDPEPEIRSYAIRELRDRTLAFTTEERILGYVGAMRDADLDIYEIAREELRLYLKKGGAEDLPEVEALLWQLHSQAPALKKELKGLVFSVGVYETVREPYSPEYLETEAKILEALK